MIVKTANISLVRLSFPLCIQECNVFDSDARKSGARGRWQVKGMVKKARAIYYYEDNITSSKLRRPVHPLIISPFQVPNVFSPRELPLIPW